MVFVLLLKDSATVPHMEVLATVDQVSKFKMASIFIKHSLLFLCDCLYICMYVCMPKLLMVRVFRPAWLMVRNNGHPLINIYICIYFISHLWMKWRSLFYTTYDVFLFLRSYLGNIIIKDFFYTMYLHKEILWFDDEEVVFDNDCKILTSQY